RKLTFLVLAPVLLFLAGCDLEDLGSSDRFTADFHYGSLKGARLSVENFNGSIEIASWDQDTIDISGVKYAGTAELRDAMKIDVATTGDTVHVRTVRPSERRGNMGAKYVIKVPRKTELDRITSSNGSIRVTDITGAARLRSSNGGIHIINTKGNVDAQTSNGNVEVQDLDGSAVLKTSNGRVHAEGVKGTLEAETSNGGINVHLTKADSGRPVKLDTSNGSIDLTVDGGNQNDVHASTSNAGITVHMPPSIGARLRAHTSNGSITSDFEVQVQGQISKHSLEGIIGAGGPVLDLSTSNGGIHLVKL
ncbi:MAG TPA: hypothetical protein VNH83_20495, partial [Bryobacteraceae bacterium]|nr:hypothetical protein [Bryobacteraceae bacterium]